MVRFYVFAFVCVVTVISGCTNESTKHDIDYEQTKKMVVDILQTDEGKKALREIMTDEKMKQHLIMESDAIKKAITEMLSSDQGSDMWKKLFEDPEFAKTFSESLAEEQKKLFKALMNDADFQKKMIELLQNPEITQQNLSLMKSQQFREHLEETIQQTLESPLFQAKMQDILLKAASKKEKKESGDKSQSEGSSDSKGENQGGGGDSEGGG